MRWARVQWLWVALLAGTGASAPLALPAVLVARAGLDEAWINESIDRFVVGAANSRGVSVDLLTVPKGHRGIDIAADSDS